MLSCLEPVVCDSSCRCSWLYHAQGDRVMVIEGDLKNLMGRVTRVADDGKVDVMPSMEGLTQVLTFEPGQLEKFFEVRLCSPRPSLNVRVARCTSC